MNACEAKGAAAAHTAFLDYTKLERQQNITPTTDGRVLAIAISNCTLA